MDALSIIPQYQPLPFPAPLWLLQTLLVLGFYLHAIPMNLVLGGTPLAATLLWLGRSDKSSYTYKTGKTVAMSLPLFISFAVTQGIVPLLFLQLVYGPMFYTSSILMAVPWLAVVGVLILGYYTTYVVIYRYLKPESSPEKATFMLLGASIVFILIAFVFSTNMTLMLYPQKWMEFYQVSADTLSGVNWPIVDAQVIPRYLHFFLAAVAIAGLLIGVFGLNWSKKDQELSEWALRLGTRIYLIVSLIQIPVGMIFLMSLPSQISRKFMGQDIPATAVFGLGMVLTLISLGAGFKSFNGRSPLAFKVTLTSALLTVLAMVVTRHQLRHFLISPYIDPTSVPINIQWDILIVFILGAIGLIIYLNWLIRMVWKAFNASSPPTE